MINITSEQLTITADKNYYKSVVEDVQTASEQGLHAIPVSEGSNGTYFLSDVNKNKIGVFKPYNEEALGSQPPKLLSQAKRIFASLFSISRTLVFCVSGNGYKAEAAANKVSRMLELNNVPITKIAELRDEVFNYTKDERKLDELPKKMGSLQMYIQEECEIAEKKLGISFWWCLVPGLAQWWYNRPGNKERLTRLVRQEDFERMVILDVVNGNLDRHFGNWMLTNDGRIYCIDNGNAFAEKHSDTFISRLNQYTWTILPHAQTKFSQEAREIIRKLNENQNMLIEKLASKGLLNDKQAKAMRDRIQLLIKLKDSCPAEFAKYKSTKQINQILNG